MRHPACEIVQKKQLSKVFSALQLQKKRKKNKTKKMNSFTFFEFSRLVETKFFFYLISSCFITILIERINRDYKILNFIEKFLLEMSANASIPWFFFLS